MSPRLIGLGVIEVECHGCYERIDYEGVEDKSECPECGQKWRLRG